MQTVNKEQQMMHTNILGVWGGRIVFLKIDDAPKFVGVDKLTLVPVKFQFPNKQPANDPKYEITPETV